MALPLLGLAVGALRAATAARGVAGAAKAMKAAPSVGNAARTAGQVSNLASSVRRRGGGSPEASPSQYTTPRTDQPFLTQNLSSGYM